MSAYYHSSARDIFVGGLISTGLSLITYMSALPRTYDYVLSTLAGFLVVVVALLPTARSGKDLGVEHFKPSGDTCDKYVGPPLCNGFQSAWGEDTVRTIHQTCASTFVVVLAALCVVFALREFGYEPQAKALLGPQRGVCRVRDELKNRRINVFVYLWKGTPEGQRGPTGQQPRAPRRRTLGYLAAALVIVASALWGLLAAPISVPFVHGEVGPTYVAEFGAFEAFGIAWLIAAWDLMPAPVQAVGNSVANAVDSVSGTAPVPTS